MITQAAAARGCGQDERRHVDGGIVHAQAGDARGRLLSMRYSVAVDVDRSLHSLEGIGDSAGRTDASLLLTWPHARVGIITDGPYPCEAVTRGIKVPDTHSRKRGLWSITALRASGTPDRSTLGSSDLATPILW
jgi:hypothetical protein